MLLTKLELHGFKSFADKTAFDFRKGITAVVGPNGCGKSNVVDAVRWILGEQRPRAIRGTEMADVIFNGTSARRSLGFAEASLTFLNDRGILPTDYSEVCITRRLYRSGESQYFINRDLCRLRDIRQLFMDTGVGVDTYSIIEQGKIDRFIQSNAQERRVIFEEAAGISRYKAQRHEAQRRLERVRINLQKVDIKLEEQRKQLRSIKYQAAKARRYREHSARLRELVVSFSVRNYREWDAQRKTVQGKITAQEGRERALEAMLAEIDAAMRQIETDIAEIDRMRLEKRDELHQTGAQIDAERTRIEHNRQRRVEFEEESELCTRGLWSHSEKLRQAREDLAAAERDLDVIRETIRRQAEAIAQETGKADAAGEECERLTQSIEEWKDRTIQIIEKATTLRNELSHMDAGRRQQLARRSRLVGQLEEKVAEGRRIDEDIRGLTGRRDEISGRLADRVASQREKETDLAGGERACADLEKVLRDLRQREASNLSRRDILQDLDIKAEDIERGVKRLLRRDDETTSGLKIMGMVADLVRADLPHAAAIEAALGDAAQYVVTKTESEADAAAALLRMDRAGQAGIIPMSRARGPDVVDLHLAAEDGVLGRACDLVRYESHLEPVVRHLLGHTWVVRNLTTALRLSNNGGGRMRYVTLDGERVDPSGAIVGGEPLPRVGLVSRKSELEAIEAELALLSEQIAQHEGEQGRRLQHVESLRVECATLRKEIEQGNLEKLSNENDILHLRNRQKSLSDEAGVIQSEVHEIEETVRGYDERQKAIEVELEQVTRRRDELQIEVESAQRRLAEQQAAAARLREAVTRLKVDLAEKQTRQGGLESGITTAREAIRDTEAQIESSRERIDELRSRQEKATEDIRQAGAAIETLTARREEIGRQMAALADQHERAQARRAEQADRARDYRAEQDALRKQLQSLRLEEQEYRVRIEGLSERVYSEHGLQLPEAVAESGDAEGEEPDWKAVEEEIETLRQKIRRMGGINEEAIAEEEGLETAIADTEAQRDDLTKAEEDLRSVIRKLNRISREQFAKTFEEIRVNFRETFRRVFNGGRADLVLDPEEPDILEAGVDVLACPPGKALESITLLSGGEKAMTTIALLFAIFRSKPSPFCILDEVDAPLDENNIGRFTSLVTDYASNSQFIIITHSKRTLEVADVLYGITMQEKGVSKKVSVQLEGASPINN